MLIGVCGLEGSGKDTIGDYLVKNYGFVNIRFADLLKDIVSIIFGWKRELLEGATIESREFREKKDEWWTKKLGMYISPRIILQKVGTELFRNNFHKDIWRIIVERKIENYINDSKNIVITDCRFMNEIEMIKQYKGTVLFVKRNLPEWFDLYRKGEIEKPTHVHDSEAEWARYRFDYSVDNNSSVGDLYEKVQNVYKSILEEFIHDT